MLRALVVHPHHHSFHLNKEELPQNVVPFQMFTGNLHEVRQQTLRKNFMIVIIVVSGGNLLFMKNSND
jgi:hypothetical protein